jgi:crossover junction endodeoxyribonuclease RusA
MMTLPYPPSANRYWRNFRGRMVKSTEARTYQATAGEAARAAGAVVLAGPVGLALRFYRPQRRGDLDNRIKVLVDALQAVAYANDSQVREIHAYLGDDPEQPRVEVEVWALPLAVEGNTSVG